MKKHFILFFAILCTPLVAWADYPQAFNEYVSDFANVIDYSTKEDLKKKLYDVEYYSGVEITVVTIDSFQSYNTGASSWESFATGLFNKWGVGNKSKNNGVLLLISTGDRKIRIELGAGYPSHYDHIMEKIIKEKIAPILKSGNYAAGVEIGVSEIINATTKKVSFFQWYKWYIVGGIFALISLITASLIDGKENPGLFWTLLAVAGILIIAIFSFLRSGNRSDGFGGGSSSGGGASGDF